MGEWEEGLRGEGEEGLRGEGRMGVSTYCGWDSNISSKRTITIDRDKLPSLGMLVEVVLQHLERILLQEQISPDPLLHLGLMTPYPTPLTGLAPCLLAALAELEGLSIR